MAIKSALFEQLILRAPHAPGRQMLPAFMYGTAWKKDATTDMVYEALRNGFTAVDTAAQPKHYREDLVAEGVRRIVREGSLRRSDIFIQTKFTAVQGQDRSSLPYEIDQPLSDQVKQSLASSLRNFKPQDDLHTESYLDCVVLHSPLATINETMEVWRTLESFVPDRVVNLGISNVDLHTLKQLYEMALIKPAVVQNRFYPSTRFDADLRTFCEGKGIVYQSFWTATANPNLLSSKAVRSLSSHLIISPHAALYCLVLSLGNIIVLNGTTNSARMKEDWTAVSRVRDFASANPSHWESISSDFKAVLGRL